MTTQRTSDAELVIIGALDTDSPHTSSDRVAHPRPGFIAPTATAGGDAPPIHDTQPAAASDWTCAHSPSRPNHSPFAARVDGSGRSRPTDTSGRSDFGLQTRSLIPVVRSLTALFLAVFSYFAVRLAVGVSGLTGTPVGATSTAATVTCGALLVLAQLSSRKAQK